MANTKSAMKRNRQNERRRLRNRSLRTKLRGAIKTARAAEGATQPAAVLEAIRALDKAVSKGVVHRNTAARKKSALARRLRRREVARSSASRGASARPGAFHRSRGSPRRRARVARRGRAASPSRDPGEAHGVRRSPRRRGSGPPRARRASRTRRTSRARVSSRVREVAEIVVRQPGDEDRREATVRLALDRLAERRLQLAGERHPGRVAERGRDQRDGARHGEAERHREESGHPAPEAALERHRRPPAARRCRSRDSQGADGPGPRLRPAGLDRRGQLRGRRPAWRARRGARGSRHRPHR